MDKKLLKSIIESTLKETEFEYQKSQGMILTESDLKSVIFRKLIKIKPRLLKSYSTADTSISAQMLHTDFSWYDHNKLILMPDISILNPKNISIYKRNDDRFQLPVKGDSFRGEAVLVVLRYIRNKTGIGKETVGGIFKKDLEKIELLFNKLKNQGTADKIFCYFAVFNKTDIKCKYFTDFLNSIQNENYKMIYATGKVKFNSSGKFVQTAMHL